VPFHRADETSSDKTQVSQQTTVPKYLGLNLVGKFQELTKLRMLKDQVSSLHLNQRSAYYLRPISVVLHDRKDASPALLSRGPK